ncbi:MAG: alpha/beta hydrolase [Actinomycetota bacterium]|nr:alpha/beta hydrolase [Actinomycetota bacterium]
MLLEDFDRRTVTVDGVRIATWVAGSGSPVLALHGYPQTHVMWHAVAPALAEDHTVVLTDLRGYGDSDQPAGGADHAGYAKRTMAADQVGVMAELGFDRFALVGHDRGARVGHRLTLDNPDRVSALAVIDIVPTHHMVATTDLAMAQAYFHWFFLSQRAPLPERLIGSDPELWLTAQMGAGHGGGDDFHPEAMAAYLEAFSRPGTITASCEDYRAAVTVDFETDGADRDRRVTCPLLVLWGDKGFIERRYDPLDVWRHYAEDVRGQALPSGHFVPEEAPEPVIDALRAFLPA